MNLSHRTELPIAANNERTNKQKINENNGFSHSLNRRLWRYTAHTVHYSENNQEHIDGKR